MKKILATILTFAVFCSLLVIPANAAGVIDSLSPVARFNPSGLANYSDGDGITTWVDSIGNQRDATLPAQKFQTGAEATAPKLKENGLNGKATAEFSSDQMNALTFSAGKIDSCTIFIVYKTTSINDSVDQFVYRASGDSIFGIYDAANGGNNRYRAGGNNQEGKWFSFNSKMSDTSFHIHALTWDIEAGKIRYFLDGELTASTNQKGKSTHNGITWIGNDWRGPNGISGEIAEIIVYDKVLTSTQLDMNGLQLAKDYGLTWEPLSDYRPPIDGAGANRLVALQESAKNGDLINIRFIGAIDSLDYSNIGFRITAAFQDQDSAVETNYDISCKYVFTSIISCDEMGEQEQWDASYFESNYLYALIIQGVPTNIGKIVFTVTPYSVSTDGQETDAASYEVVYQDGKFISAKEMS